ncbi:MAG: hypothetical protein QF654_09080 [Alphaproteobacteria bacterium]|nr:hypothetical protein [Alphaproteobacteria bacterium]
METCARIAGSGAMDSVETCRKAAAEVPRNVAVLRNLSTSLSSIGDFNGAVEVERRIVALLPDDARAHYDLAGTLGFVRRYGEAVGPIETAIRLRPGNIPSYQAAAIIYVRLGRISEAISVTQKAAELGDPISMFDLAGYFERGIGVDADPAQAFLWTRRAAESGHVYAMRLLASVYLEGGLGQPPDDAKAEDWARRARAASR